MRRQDFYYNLPDELIALKPAEQRAGSRLMHVDGPTGSVTHRQFKEILSLVQPGDLMVFNNTKVIPARVYGNKITGGQVEVLIERIISDRKALAHIRSSRSPKAGAELTLGEKYKVQVEGREGSLFKLDFGHDASVLTVLEEVGHIPLPPYIEREDDSDDRQRYQTVYSRDDKKGAVAAPTAGLHFDDRLMEALTNKGVNLGFVTLHVGAGTFQPVKVDDIHNHQMHSEWMEVDESLCDLVKSTKASGGRVIAVGTTSVRCLETASKNGNIEPFTGDTDIFIYPGYEFRCIDALVTNFHLPESTLIMLVSAFTGYQHTMAAYAEAVAERYRFFSYGDAMFVTKNLDAVNEPIAQSGTEQKTDPTEKN